MSVHNPKRDEPLAIGGETTKFGTCTLCEAMCGIEITVQNGNVTSVRGDKLDPLSRGHICPKATALVDIHTDPDRLRRPVRRTEHGWQEMEWEEAIDLVARRLVETRRAHGANAVGIYQGNPNVHSLGAMTHGKSFLALLNTRNRFSATSLDQLPHQLTNMLLYGHQLRQPITDIDHTQFFLVLGANPMASNGSMMTVPDFGKRVKELKARGGRLVVVDPRRTETAAVADTHIFIRPGTDSYLLLALMNTIIGENLARPADYVDGLDALADAVRPYTPDAVAALVGIDADTITELARDFASAECGAAYGRMGVSTQQFGSVCQWAVQVLNIITGNLDRVGGTMFTDPALDLIAQNIAGRGSFDRWRSRVRQLPEFSGEIPSSTLVDEMTTDGHGQIRSMVVAAGNPVLSTPGGKRLDEAFAALDFMVSIDIYVNETSRHADVILPATTALEREHYDIVLSSFAVRNVAKFVPAAVPKPVGSRHDWEIYRDLGLRYLSLRRGEDRSALGKLRARTLGRLDSASLINEIKMRLSPAHSLDVLFLRARNGVSLKVLRSHPHGLDLGPLRPALPGKLKTRNKRIQLMQPTITANLPSLAAATTPSDVELLLIGRRHLRSNNSWMHNSARLVKGKPRHHLLVHPDDLRVRGIDEGSVVRVSSVAGFVDVEVAASEQMMRGVVSLPHGFGHTKPGIRTRVASGVSGPNANDVTDPNQVDTVSANAVLNGIPVQITAPPEAHV